MIKVSIPVPPTPILENALGYKGQARWIATYWEPGGDEAMVSDGRISFTGNYEGYLLYYRHCQFRLCDFNLGSSDDVADDWLVIDLYQREAFIAPRKEARAILTDQWPKTEIVRLSPEQWQELAEQVLREMRQVPQPTIEEIRDRWEKNLNALAALRAWLNQN